MSWSRGCEVCAEVFDVVLPLIKEYKVPEDVAIDVIVEIIEVFEREDCDNLDELIGEDVLINKAIKKAFPEYYEY